MPAYGSNFRKFKIYIFTIKKKVIVHNKMYYRTKYIVFIRNMLLVVPSKFFF